MAQADMKVMEDMESSHVEEFSQTIDKEMEKR